MECEIGSSVKNPGFTRCAHEQAVYVKESSKDLLIVGVYVDDLIVTGASETLVSTFKKEMMKMFDMSDLGMLSYYLGIEVCQSKGTITISHAGYAKKIIQCAGMAECNPCKYPMEAKLKLTKDEDGVDVNATDYRRLIGSLSYLVNTRPDISYSVGVISRFMESLKVSHLNALKQIVRYIKGTTDYGLVYRRGGDGKLLGYSNSSHGVDIIDRKGTTGMVFYFSGNLISWNSSKQKTMALSSCEAEFIAAKMAACQALCL
ncbi:uncharacterized mitochondrial protein AtMg00810-like [Rutidosis leptorrhynchoides]|uniref:uncharacterized mitochondrial protein AtMg00810-like n=1 Tax=Rutidosis leptorrhynchoides TaxID=125765 RepID=UPI003A9A1A84